MNPLDLQYIRTENALTINEYQRHIVGVLVVYCWVKITLKIIGLKQRILLSNGFYGLGIWEGPSPGVLGQDPSGSILKVAHSHDCWQKASASDYMSLSHRVAWVSS